MGCALITRHIRVPHQARRLLNVFRRAAKNPAYNADFSRDNSIWMLLARFIQTVHIYVNVWWRQEGDPIKVVQS